MSKANQNHLSNYEVETAVMQRFDSNEFFYCDVSDSFYKLQDSNSWYEYDNRLILREIRRGFDNVKTDSIDNKLPEYFNSDKHHERCLDLLKVELKSEQVYPHIVPLQDCVINLATGKREDYKPEYHITKTLPFSYAEPQQLNPRFGADYRRLYSLFTGESNCIVLDKPREYADGLRQLIGERYQRYNRYDYGQRGFNPKCHNSSVCEIVSTHRKIPYDFLSDLSVDPTVNFKRNYSNKYQQWENTCTFLITFDPPISKRKPKTLTENVEIYSFMDVWKPQIPIEQITPELILGILETYGVNPDKIEFERPPTRQNYEAGKGGWIFDYLHENYENNPSGYAIVDELRNELIEYAKAGDFTYKQVEIKKVIRGFTDIANPISTRYINKKSHQVYVGLSKKLPDNTRRDDDKQDLPSAAPTVELNLDGKVTHSDKVLSTLNKYFQISKNKGTARRMLIAFLKHNHPETFSDLADDEIMRYCLKPLHKFCKLGFDYPEEINKQGDRVLRGLKFNKTDESWELYQRIKKTKSVVEEATHE